MVHTANVFIELRSGHDNWHWIPSPWGALPEYVYTRPELLKVLRTYGVWGSRMYGGAHIRITAQGRFSGRWCAAWEWYSHQPVTDPWVHWPAWENLCFAAQLHVPYYTEHDDVRMIETGGTDVSTLRMRPVPADGIMPEQVPHVRHREDVPHEHALPDLYGLRRAQ